MFKCGLAELKAHQLIIEVNMTMGTQHVLLLLVSVHDSRIMLEIVSNMQEKQLINLKGH